MKDAGICLKASRNLKRHSPELAPKPGFDPSSCRSAVGDSEVVALHRITVAEEHIGRHLDNRGEPRAAYRDSIRLGPKSRLAIPPPRMTEARLDERPCRTASRLRTCPDPPSKPAPREAAVKGAQRPTPAGG